MSLTTGIAWTDSTFNPWIGCSHAKNSPACAHCYAESLNKFWRWNGGTWGPGAPRKLSAETSWDLPPKLNKRAARGARGKDGKHWLVFAGDLCDIFDDEGPAEARERMWELFRSTGHLTWQLLTKRPENFQKYLPADWRDGYPNVWVGVTAENNVQAQRRIAILKETPARLRFVSFEPLLEEVRFDLSNIDWAIVGGESGGKARPFNLAWARSLQKQCVESGTAFFCKQLGANPFENETPVPLNHPKKNGKRDTSGTALENFPADLRVQSWPKFS